MALSSGIRTESDPDRTRDVRQTYMPHFNSIHPFNANSLLARITKHTLPSKNRFWDWVRRKLVIDPERSSGVSSLPKPL
jgi:hypothetical protein